MQFSTIFFFPSILFLLCLAKGKSIHVEAYTDLQDSRSLRIPKILGKQHMKMVMLSAIGTRGLQSQETFLVLILLEIESTAVSQCGRINDLMGNRTRNLSNCSSVPEPNAPPRTSLLCLRYKYSFQYSDLKNPRFLCFFQILEWVGLNIVALGCFTVCLGHASHS